MHEVQHQFPSRDGLGLFAREYIPGDRSAHRNLLLVHGGCEHGGRYAEFAQALTSNGWRVLVADLRGHGRSQGVRVHVRRFDEYLNDVRAAYRFFQLSPSNSAILGHSMGGLVAARLLAIESGLFSAACFLSPFFGLAIKVERHTWILGQVLAYLWPTFRFRSRVTPDDLSSDRNYLEKRREDTLIVKSVTVSWFFAIQRALQQAQLDAAVIQTPLLVLQGDADRVVIPQATVSWFEQVNSEDKTLELLPGHLHELLREPDREETIQRILTWLETRVENSPR